MYYALKIRYKDMQKIMINNAKKLLERIESLEIELSKYKKIKKPPIEIIEENNN